MCRQPAVLSSGPALLSRDYCSSVSIAAAAQSLGSRLGQCTQNCLQDLATRLVRETAVANRFSPFGYHPAPVAKKMSGAVHILVFQLFLATVLLRHSRHAALSRATRCQLGSPSSSKAATPASG
jgi:hypothetical protein